MSTECILGSLFDRCEAFKKQAAKPDDVTEWRLQVEAFLSAELDVESKCKATIQSKAWLGLAPYDLHCGTDWHISSCTSMPGWLTFNALLPLAGCSNLIRILNTSWRLAP